MRIADSRLEKLVSDIHEISNILMSRRSSLDQSSPRLLNNSDMLPITDCTSSSDISLPINQLLPCSPFESARRTLGFFPVTLNNDDQYEAIVNDFSATQLKKKQFIDQLNSYF